jgi:hypothetical protein
MEVPDSEIINEYVTKICELIDKCKDAALLDLIFRILLKSCAIQ